MTLQIIMGSVLTIVGILALFLGVIFLAGSKGMVPRLITGGVLCSLGSAALGAGIILFRKGMRSSPEGIRKELLRLAKRNNGEISDDAIIASLGSSDTVKFVIADVVRMGVARETVKDGRTVYLFKDFQLALVFKKCPYCGNDYPVRDNIERCPSCGGDLKLAKVSLGADGDVYSMDDEEDSTRH